MKPFRIQFVCLGNICRSPAAEGVMRQLVGSRGLSDWVLVDSAGTADYQIGRPADSRMIAAASRRGYKLSSRAKQFERSHLRERDLILAMDRDNFREIQRFERGVAEHVRLFSEFLDDSWPTDVPDPYYGGEDGFEYVLDMLEAGCPRVLEEIQKKITAINPT